MLEPGSKIGPYTVEREIGRGGMGVVYLAGDSRLGRKVAIKALPEAFSGDPDRLARFELEARTLAALNHPNIAAIYGLEDALPDRYLVLEFVEGESLADRLRHGPFAVEDALPLARQVAGALEASHELGIVHRDLKPGNVVVRRDGTVKVLDFGLARRFEITGLTATADPDSPTLTAPPPPPSPTIPGAILGSAGYMSPEQARGKVVDKRSDIFSFGCVLYEMLGGVRPFRGDTLAEYLGALLHREPEWECVAGAPRRVRELLRHCLEKDPRERLRDIGDARLELSRSIAGREWAAPEAAGTGEVLPPRNGLRSTAPWALAGLAVVGAGWMAWRAREERVPTPAPVLLEITAPPKARIDVRYGGVAISPDGRRVVFGVMEPAGTTRLWVRELDEIQSRPLPGTEESWLPFWAPDGRQIAFFSADGLMKVSIDGGTARTICPAPDGRGGAWSDDGIIVFAPSSEGPLLRVSADGGTPTEVTRLKDDPRQLGHRFPQFVRGGRFIFTTLPRRENGYEVYMGSLDSAEVRLLCETEMGATWDQRGVVLVLRDGALTAVPINPATGARLGAPTPVGLTPEGRDVISVAPIVSVSPSGAAAFVRGGAGEGNLVLLDRGGAEREVVPNARGRFFLTRFSPDGRRLATVRVSPRLLADVWLVDLDRGVSTRLTTSGNNVSPVWSQDGAWVYFASDRLGHRDLYRVSPAGGAEERILGTDSLFAAPFDVTPDGSRLFFGKLDSARQGDLWVIPLPAADQPEPFLVTPFYEDNVRVSPDGRWIAYTSDETGRTELYVRALQGGDATHLKRQVTSFGVTGPVQSDNSWLSWRHDGRELICLSTDGRSVYAVDVEATQELKVGTPRRLFDIPEGASGFCPAPDHQSFAVAVPIDASPPTVAVVSDWRAYLTLEPEADASAH